MKTLISSLVVGALMIATPLLARDKAPFSVCIIQTSIPDKDEKKRVKNIRKHLTSRFEGEISSGSSPTKCDADLYLLRALEGQEDSRDWSAGTGTGLAKTATVGLRIIGFAPGQEEPTIDQLFAGKQGFMTRGAWSSKGGAEKSAIKKIHEWADENRDAISAALR